VAADDATPERWKAVPGWGGLYEVSDQGRVRSLDRLVACKAGATRTHRGKILSQWTDSRGQPAVSLYSDGGREREHKPVHLLVQEAFDPPAAAVLPGPWAQERWLPVVGFEDWYEVSDLGRVRSYHPPYGARGRRRKPYMLTPTAKGTGKYLMVTLRQGDRVECVYVHTLVLTAFVGDRPPKNEARHGPNGRYDNSRANLCWGTMQENHQDRVRDGGEAKPRAKLSSADVLECRRRYAAGEKQVDLAREFGVSSSGLCQAIKGTTWKDI
jgi:NUMOD4 motif-containing protein